MIWTSNRVGRISKEAETERNYNFCEKDFLSCFSRRIIFLGEIEKMKILHFLLLLLFCVIVQGANLISNVLGSNMVLQRSPTSAVIWGWTSRASDSVVVTFNGKKYSTTSGSDSHWSVRLDPTPAGGPYTISVDTGSGAATQLTNVLFGDVILCSGQSNMQMTVSEVFNATEEAAKANNYPNIRVFTVGQTTVSNTPLPELASIEQPWSVSSSASIGAAAWSYFSAACWFFGRDLYDRYKVPLGLISSNWGGTIIQAWMSPQALKKCNGTNYLENVSPSMQKIMKEIKVESMDITKLPSEMGPKNNDVHVDPNQNSVLWNAMIVPYLPMRISMAVWYQAESNVYGFGLPQEYVCLFPNMISDWRIQFGNGFPFFFVQLAPYYATNLPLDNWPLMRLAQTAGYNAGFVGMGTAADLGDINSPWNNIHPRDKQDVGHRLSLAARAIAYGELVQFLGPTATGARVVEGPTTFTVVIDFAPTSIGSGLILVPASCPLTEPKYCGKPFEVLVNRIWEEATPELSASSLLLSVSKKAKPTSVRSLWANWPLCRLYNRNGLPATPFYFNI